MYRYNPTLVAQGQNPLLIDSKEATISLEQYAYNETRYRMLVQSDETRAEALLKEAQQDVKSRWSLYEQLAAMHYGNGGANDNGNGNGNVGA
jgi:pyruvate-ferredoxin/flavodoxin oxidoreductase